MIIKTFVILGIGILCIPVFLFLIPDIEQGRQEARLAQAYHQVIQISRENRIASFDSSTVGDVIADTDPWGQPYRRIKLSDGQVRVLSSGPNMSSPESGIDEDDIYSDMPVSPAAVILMQKRRQLLLAFCATAGVWLLLSIVFLRSWRDEAD